MREMVTIASNLRRLAAFPRSLAVASLAQAEAAICAGHVDQGEQLLDYVATINARRGNLAHTAIETMLRANVAFFRGNVNLADRLASGAYAVLRGRHLEARACAVLVARSRSASDLAWNPTDLAENLAPSSSIDSRSRASEPGIFCGRRRRLAPRRKPGWYSRPHRPSATKALPRGPPRRSRPV